MTLVVSLRAAAAFTADGWRRLWASCDGDPVRFTAFLAAWPETRAEEHADARREWNRLGEADRRASIEGLPRWIAQYRSSGRRHFPSARRYLAERRWERLTAQAEPNPGLPSQAGQPAGSPHGGRRGGGLLEEAAPDREGRM